MENKQTREAFVYTARRGLPVAFSLLVAAITLISITNCSEPTPIVWKEPAALPPIDRSLLTDSPCTAPCWQNITPGLSNEDDVRQQLEACPFVREGSISRGETERSGVKLVRFTWESAAGPWDKRIRGARNYLYLRDNVVLSMRLYLEYELTLKQVVEKYGPPEAIKVVRHPPDASYQILMDYSHQGLDFRVLEVLSDEDFMEGKAAPVFEDMKVTSVRYFVPTSIEGKLRDVLMYDQEGIEYALRYSQEWHGFGEYSWQ